MAGNSDLIDLTLQVHAKTERAVFLSETGVAKDAKWVPLSQIEMEPHGASKTVVVVTMPKWLAVDRKFV